MDLILWRHAEAADGVPDAARELTPKGVKQAQNIAAWLRHHVTGPVKVITSPAVRAQQTAHAYLAQVTVESEIATDATAARLLKAAQWPDAQNTVLVVGHQPTLGAAAALAMTGKAMPWAIKKGAIWWLRSTAGGPPLVVAVITPKLARRA